MITYTQQFLHEIYLFHFGRGKLKNSRMCFGEKSENEKNMYFLNEPWIKMKMRLFMDPMGKANSLNYIAGMIIIRNYGNIDIIAANNTLLNFRENFRYQFQSLVIGNPCTDILFCSPKCRQNLWHIELQPQHLVGLYSNPLFILFSPLSTRTHHRENKKQWTSQLIKCKQTLEFN